MLKYKRIILKLSGEALMGDQNYGIDTRRLNEYSNEVLEILNKGVEIGIVIGGGNIFRGLAGVKEGFQRVRGDYMGMLATVINGLAIQSAIEAKGIKCRVFSAIRMEPVVEYYSNAKVLEAFKNKEIVIFVAGTGNPFFTTDTASALRAIETGADALLKGTRVDGVYNNDPEKDPSAIKYNKLSFDEAIEKRLLIMDSTAFTLCRENNLPIIVFDMNKKGNLKNIIMGENVGTLIEK